MTRRPRALRLKLKNLYDLAWLTMPVSVWFSYYPNLHFGQDSTMNFEVSLPLIGLAVLALVSLPGIWRKQHQLVKSRLVWLVSALVLYTSVTILWSVNPVRGLLTAGILVLLFMVFLGVVSQKERLVKLLPVITRVFVASAVVMSVLAIIQFLAGIWLAQGVTLLCNGCVSQQFGFPRPNVFTIEPQFFGNLLLAPALVVAHRFLTSKGGRWEIWALVIMMLAMFLTMSRGAIFALAVGLVILFIVNRRHIRRIVSLVGLSLLAIVTSLLMQGGAAAASPVVSESFVGGVSKSINQLTIGVVDIKVAAPVEEVEAVEDKDLPVFDGYVEESTEIRANRTDLALEAWRQSPLTILFGAGVGGAGVAMHKANPELIGAREIVQNEYVERLLERGLIGLGLSVAVITVLFYGLRHNKWLWAVVTAFLFQLMLFSGYPNALHIYLTLVLLGVITFLPKQKTD